MFLLIFLESINLVKFSAKLSGLGGGWLLEVAYSFSNLASSLWWFYVDTGGYKEIVTLNSQLLFSSSKVKF